ncbi:MAG: dioxygenase [Fidelibacterota bacterium]
MGLKFILFSGHSPFLIKDQGHPESQRALTQLSEPFKNLDLVAVVSSHWVSHNGFLANNRTQPRFIQDYYGFSKELYDVSYPCIGDPQFAQEIITYATRKGLTAQATSHWGMDHGHWTPLLWLLPDADIPVVPLSISNSTPEQHVLWGQAIREAAEQSSLSIGIIISAALTHRLDKITWGRNEPFPEGERFDHEVINIMLTGAWNALDTFDKALFHTAAPEGGWGPLATLRGLVGNSALGKLVCYERMFTGATMATVAFEISTESKMDFSYDYSTIVGRT